MVASPSAVRRSNAISQMASNSAANPTQMGTIPGWDIAGGQNDPALLNYLASLYGWNTQGNIAGLNAQTSLQQQGLQNQGLADVANIQGQFGLDQTRLGTDAQRYGHDRQFDIADLQGRNTLEQLRLQNELGRYGFDRQYDIEGLRGQNQMGLQGLVNQGQLGIQGLQNQGALGVEGLRGQNALGLQGLVNQGSAYGWDTQRDIARLQQQNDLARTGMEQQGLLGRGLMDNLGGDYRTGLGAQVGMAQATYAPQLQSDLRGHAMNNFVSPVLQTLLGITPGDPYQTRDAPQLQQGGQPDYLGALQSLGIPGQSAQQAPAPQTTPAPPQQSGRDMQPFGFNTPNPLPPGVMAGGNVAGGGPGPQRTGQPSNLGQTFAPHQQQQLRQSFAGLPGQFTPPQPPGGLPAPPPPRPGGIPPNDPRFGGGPGQPGSAPQQGQPQQFAQATQSMTPSVYQPLPTSFAGPQITQGPVMGQGAIQSLIGRQHGQNAAAQARADLGAQRQAGAQGFAGGSPVTMALQQQNALGRQFADQEASTTIPAQYAQMNAQHRLASQLGASNVFGQRTQEELGRRGQESQFTQGLLHWLSSLMG